MSWILPSLLLVLSLLACAHVLLHRTDARSAALWLLILLTLPGLGLILYLALGLDRIRRKALIKEAANREIREAFAAFLPPSSAAYVYPEDLPAPAFGPDAASGPDWLEFYPTLDRLLPRPLLTGNHIRLFSQGDQVYERMLDAIARANHHVNLETYIFQADRVGRQLIEIMAQAAARGVEVRILYDSVGSIDSLAFLDALSHTTLRTHAFAPLNPIKRGLQVNLRNHRKLLVVDGILAFTGGMNINETHLVDHPLLTRVKDYHFEAQGPVVQQMQEWFIEDWYYATGESLLTPPFFPPPSWRGEDVARVITSGPDGDYEIFYEAILAAIAGARRRIFIATPYFIPDQGFTTALRLAAARGVEVTLVLPGHSDHPFVTWASRTYYGALLEAGIHIYERRAPFLHSKVLVIDDAWATIGSANMDVRSFRLNFEANLEVRSPRLAQQLLEAVRGEIAASRLIDLASYRARPIHQRLLEHACALWSPLL